MPLNPFILAFRISLKVGSFRVLINTLRNKAANSWTADSSVSNSLGILPIRYLMTVFVNNGN